MTDLIMPTDGPRICPRTPEQVNANVRAELDKATDTWGIPNNLARTMACHPRLAQTEIDYVNSFIFDENEFGEIPRPGNLKTPCCSRRWASWTALLKSSSSPW